MKKFVTSDIHFNHKNIINFCPETRGQYSGMDEMNQDIVDRFNKDVSEEDHTYIIGDLCFGHPKHALEFLKEMNGTKTLVFGNHDRRLKKSDEFNNAELRRLAGLVEFDWYHTFHHTVDQVKYGIVLFHFRIAEWEDCHHGSIHLYGHSHGTGPKLDTRCMDVGMETNEMRPYLLDDVVRKLRNNKVTYSGHHDGSR